ncbi:uroporphyrinogen-III synthase [Marasmius tenuissimus]|uniref:Uroporphyrinogen-III synthase n=1 Tax=Marasmius tenuissimus TaxID=585030 RepID=A0ABR2ZFK0_9AGAR
MSSKSTVILLRAPTETEDKYEAAFSAIGYASHSVPVLETSLTNIDELERIIQTGPVYDGVIITSARACEAWRDAVDSLEDRSTEITGDSWQEKPFFVVGKGTGSSLADIHARHPRSPLVPNPSLIKGEDCGNANELGRFIVEDFKSKPVKLLYLTGDKNRDTLPNILRDGDVDFHALKVYETQGSSSFPNDLRSTLDKANPDTVRWWIVFFAPSAAQFVLPYLKEHFTLPGSTDASETSKPLASIASIGPTTDTYLRETLKLHVGAMATKPTPEDLVRAITAADATGHS